MESQISSLFGGRIAEALIFGEDFVTTGASNDIERATEIARKMVTQWGLSDKLGPLTYGEAEGEVFLGKQSVRAKEFSDETASMIDKEIRLFIDRNYERALAILNENMDKLHIMAEALIKYETIETDQIADIMAGRPISAPKGWQDLSDDDQSSGGVTSTEDNNKNNTEGGEDGSPALSS